MHEELHPQVPVGEFADEGEWQALSAELARLDEFDAKKDILRDQATGPLLTFTCVRTVKNGAPNYRVCLRLLVDNQKKSKNLCSARDLDIGSTRCCFAAHYGWSVLRLECSVSTKRMSKSNSWLCLGNNQKKGMVWKRHPLILMNFLSRCRKIFCDECGSFCLRKLMPELATFQSKLTGGMMCEHMDDGVLVGPNEAPILLLNTSCLQLGRGTTFCGSVNTTPHTSHFLTVSHAHAWLKSCVCRARITCHDSSSCAHVFVLTLFDCSTFLSLLTIFSLIILSFLLRTNFIFQDVVDKFHSRK